MKVNIKKTELNSTIPTYAKQGDAGLDLVAAKMYYDSLGNICYDTGIALEIPEGYVGLVFPRSSVSKYLTFLTNSVGVIDSGYRGTITMKFKPTETYHNRVEDPNIDDVYKVGDKIGQLIILPYPIIEFVEVEFLNDSERGNNGYGSTGK